MEKEGRDDSQFSFQAPHTLHMRSGVKMGDASLQDSMVADGLTDAFHGYHMGITGEVHLNCEWPLLVAHHYNVINQLRMWQSSGRSAESSRICLLSNPRTEPRLRRKQVILTKRSFRSR